MFGHAPYRTPGWIEPSCRPRTRRAPSPQRGEGRGEGQVTLNKPLPPHPARKSAPTSPRWGEVEQVEWPWICGSPQRRLEPRARRRRFPDGDPDGSDVAPVAAEPAGAHRFGEALEHVPGEELGRGVDVLEFRKVVEILVVERCQHLLEHLERASD